MTIARATVSGAVYRQPEKRFTSNNVAITDFALNLSDREEDLLVRVVAFKGIAALVDSAHGLSKAKDFVAVKKRTSPNQGAAGFLGASKRQAAFFRLNFLNHSLRVKGLSKSEFLNHISASFLSVSKIIVLIFF